MDIQTALITAVKCFIRGFSRTKIGLDQIFGQVYRIRISPGYWKKNLDWIKIPKPPNCSTLTVVRKEEMTWTANGADFGGRWGWTSVPLTIFLAIGLHQAARWCWKNLLIFFLVERTTRWQQKWLKPLGIPLPLLYFKANLLFPYVSNPSGATGRYKCWTNRIFLQS